MLRIVPRWSFFQEFPDVSNLVRSNPIRFVAAAIGTIALLMGQPRLLRGQDAETPAAADAETEDVIKSAGADVSIIDEQDSSSVEPTYGNPIATRMRVGARVEAKGGEVRDIFIMVAVPLETAEQEVHVIEEDFSSNIGSVEFRNLPDQKLTEPGARQMLISIPLLGARQTANAVVTYDILTKHVYAPEETAELVIPDKPPRQLKPYLSGSPYINVNDRKIRDAIEEALEQRVSKEGASSGTELADDAPVSDAGAEEGYDA
jgi:hypothetical protein